MEHLLFRFGWVFLSHLQWAGPADGWGPLLTTPQKNLVAEDSNVMSRNWTWGGLCVILLRHSVLGLARPESLGAPAAEVETAPQQRGNGAHGSSRAASQERRDGPGRHGPGRHGPGRESRQTRSRQTPSPVPARPGWAAGREGVVPSHGELVAVTGLGPLVLQEKICFQAAALDSVSLLIITILLKAAPPQPCTWQQCSRFELLLVVGSF